MVKLSLSIPFIVTLKLFGHLKLDSPSPPLYLEFITAIKSVLRHLIAKNTTF